MATKKIESKEKNVREVVRRIALAYVGAFGVAADEFGKLFELFVTRGERIEKDARKIVKQNSKEVNHFAKEVQKEQKQAVAKATKSVKKASKRVEHALA